MQGRISGFFMTLVMALPLAAIPLMSIFGIPQFGSLASMLDEETGFLPEDPNSGSQWDSAPAFGAENSREEASNANNLMLTPASNTLSTDAAFSVTPSTNRFMNSSINSPEKWEQAIQQLARYGIHDYRIEPGLEANTSHFACYLRTDAVGQSASTVIRFEAEATNRLQAVQKALLQIEQWHR